MKRLVEKHPLAIRWCHWINFPVLVGMVWSGLLIYWADDIFRVGFGDHTLLRMQLSDDLYARLRLDHRLAEGMAWHFALAWAFAINGLVYVSYTLVSGLWRQILPDRRSFRDAIEVVRRDLGLSRSAPAREKYNGAQRIAYTAIIVMGLISLLTGLSIYKPVQLAWLAALFGGYPAARFIHFWLAMGFAVFFAIHVVQVARAGWSNFRGMVTGFEVEERASLEGARR